MSHRDHTSYLPYVSSVSPDTVTDSGSQTITITGSGLTPTTEVSVPSNLGVLTGRSFVQNSSVSQSIVLTVTVAEPPGTPVARLIGLKNGGLGTTTASVDHGWSPSAVSGLSLWLDADDASTITESGGSISQWDDKSGNDHHVSQPSTATQPTLTASGLNSRSVVTFSFNHHLHRDDALGFSGNPAVTALVVFNNGYAGDRRIFEFGKSQQNGQVVSLSSDASWRYNNGNRLFNNDQFGIDVPTIGAWRTQAGETYGDGEFWSNGVEATATGGGGSNVVNVPTVGSTTSIGVGGYNNRIAGDIAELIVYDSYLSNTDREAVEEYLADKWGITL